ncbi:tetratricopeptide repeat protein [Tenacibaculum aestuarii]|uniref:tetratricopeptide repeat protein n=1 Tax=Tenacibaculum aestuarii TaxID=362781 RepID=UPI0038952022
MKKITYLLTGLFLFVAVNGAKAQASQECHIKYNLFKGDATTKKYAQAKPNLEYLLDNCAGLSINIYKYGAKVAENLKDPVLAKKVYETRLANFPDKDPAKAHSDYAEYLIENKLASDEEVFEILKKAYDISPKDMGVKNIFRYFEAIAEKYQDTDPQKVFDTYDDVMESVDEKLEDYSKKIAKLQEKDSVGTITSREKKNLRAYTINSSSLGQVEGGLDAKISKIATCERLIPIYSRDFESKKTDGVWLKRAVSRMYNKECTADPLFEKLANEYAKVTQSADAYNFLAGVLAKHGDKSGAAEMRKKAFDLETDPFKKAKYKLREAQSASGSRARALAYEALKYNPNMGKAYLFIASLYQRSANSCGSDEFEKRMVYVAALNKAIKANQVDPGCGAGRYISSYKKNVPSKKLVFQKGMASGASYRVGCWIGETVRVP